MSKEYTFELPLKILLAANVFASTEDSRYYLNGVHVRGEDKNIRVESTDGHRAIVFNVATDQDLSGMDYIIPSEGLEIKTNKRAPENAKVTLNGRYAIEYDGTVKTGAPIDGTFPDIDRVMPKEEREASVGAGIGVNAGYIGDFAKVNKILGIHAVVKFEFGDAADPIRVTTAAYKGVVMPFRV